MNKRGKLYYQVGWVEEWHERLAVAVIVRAFKDLQEAGVQNKSVRGEAWNWFFDDEGGFWYWCEMGGVDGHRIRRNLRAST